MIRSLIVTNYLGNRTQYNFGEVEPESGFIVTNIDGMGPVKADVNTSHSAVADGDTITSTRLSGRNLVIEGIFMHASTIEEARLKSYKYFPIGKKVTIRIVTDNRIGETTGVVESNEPTIFSEREEFQISIICESPFFNDVGENGVVETMFAGVDKKFEFPFTNNSITENLIEFSELVTKKTNTVYYNGDSETGVLITIHALGDVGDIDIYNTQTREHMSIDMSKLASLTGSGMVNGDSIEINTTKGDRSVTLIRDGHKTNVLNILGKHPDWFTLSKGDNTFTFTADDGEENLTFTIKVQTTFDGV